MDLYKELLVKLLEKETLVVRFENVETTPIDQLELTCYHALQEIKSILENDALSDSECFTLIEEIVCLFEHLGSGCGTRHDWG